LTLLKQAGVSNKSLGLIAVKFKLHELTLMDIPELDNLQREFTKLRSSFEDIVAHPEKLQAIQINEIKLLGDVFEGLIGAILIDNDFNYI
jgi:dsRNA-specific ribonuclease